MFPGPCGCWYINASVPPPWGGLPHQPGCSGCPGRLQRWQGRLRAAGRQLAFLTPPSPITLPFPLLPLPPPSQSVDVKAERILLDRKEEAVDADSLSQLVPEGEGRYHFYQFKHTHEGDYQEAIGMFPLCFLLPSLSLLPYSFLPFPFLPSGFNL